MVWKAFILTTEALVFRQPDTRMATVMVVLPTPQGFFATGRSEWGLWKGIPGTAAACPGHGTSDTRPGHGTYQNAL